MISKAVGNVIFTTIGSPPHDNLACVLAEFSKHWGWIWFSFLELLKIRGQYKKMSLFLLSVLVSSAVKEDAEVWWGSCQNRRWSSYCMGSTQRSSLQFLSLSSSLLDLSSLWQRRPSSPVYTFVHENCANACPCCTAVSEIFQTPSLTGCFAVLSGCGGELSGPSGSFHSPGYPNRYPSNRECIWYIHTAPGSSIQLTIHELDVAYHPDCSYDVLEVRAKIHKLHGFLSGVDNPKNCRSRTNNSTAISHFCCGYSSVPQRLSQKQQRSYYFWLSYLWCLYTLINDDARHCTLPNKRQNCFEKLSLQKSTFYEELSVGCCTMVTKLPNVEENNGSLGK